MRGGSIPKVWIVNLPERAIEVYTAPGAGEYTVARRVSGGDPLAPTAFLDMAIDTAALLQSRACATALECAHH